MIAMACQVTSLRVVYSTVYSDADKRKHQSSASLAFVWGSHRDRWIPAQRASYAENVSIWWRHHAWYWVYAVKVPFMRKTSQWRHNGRDSVSNHQPRECLLNRLIRSRSKKTSKLRVTALCARNSPETGEFPAQRASNAENVSIWWRHHEKVGTRWSMGAGGSV